MLVEKTANYVPATSATEAAAAAVAACVCSVYGSNVKVVSRHHRGALCCACVGRVVQCSCDVVTLPRSQSTTTLLSDRSCLHQRNAARGAPASACSSKIVEIEHGGVIDLASASCQPSAALPCRPSRRLRAGMASPHGLCIR